MVHGPTLHPVLGSLLELVHSDTVESFAHRLLSRGKARADTPASFVQPQDGRANDRINEFIAELGSEQNVNPETDTDARVLPIIRDKAGLRPRTFAEAVSTLEGTSWVDWPITGPRTFLWYVRFILTYYTSSGAWNF